MPALSAEIVRRIIILKPLVVSGTRTHNVVLRRTMEPEASSIQKGDRLILGLLECQSIWFCQQICQYIPDAGLCPVHEAILVNQGLC